MMSFLELELGSAWLDVQCRHTAASTCHPTRRMSKLLSQYLPTIVRNVVLLPVGSNGSSNL
eukprot:scaffold292503_cov48-Prasinocladus_malaysianus.AAC.2